MASFDSLLVIRDPDELSASIKVSDTLNITAIARATNVVTVTTDETHAFINGDYVIVSGTTDFNGTFGPITVTSTTEFTYAETGTDQSEISGSVVETRTPGTDVFIDAINKTITLYADGTGALTVNGVTLKALYSFLKDQWKGSPQDQLIKFSFPLTPITDEQFEFYNGWNLDKVTTSGPVNQTTPQLVRTGGWSVRSYDPVLDQNGDDTERWLCVISLGQLGTEDQVYFQQDDADATTENVLLTGIVNQAIQYYRDDDADGVGLSPDYDYSTFLKVFVREWGKTYSSSSLEDIGVETLNPQVYRFPLSNTNDSKIIGLEISESAASGDAYDITSATWLANEATITTDVAHGYITGDVVTIAGVDIAAYNGGDYTITDVPTPTTFTYELLAGSDPGAGTGGTVSGYVYNNMSITWYQTGQQYTDFVDPPLTAYFSVVIDADVGDLFVSNPTVSQVYAFVQAQLRKTVNVNAGSISEGTGDKIGKVSPELLTFVGDNLNTLGVSDEFTGVYVDNYNALDINNLTFWGYGSASVSSFNIQSIERLSNTVTVTTTANNDFAQDDLITISGVTGFDGTYKISVNSLTEFTYTQTGADATGTVSPTTSLAKPAEYTTITFPFTAILTLNFGQNLVDDPDAIYRVFFTNDDAGDNLGRDYGTKDAIIVEDKDGGPIAGLINGTASIPVNYDYDSNEQRGSLSKAKPAPITAVAIGLTKAQYVVASTTIERSILNTISLIAPVERNYQP